MFIGCSEDIDIPGPELQSDDRISFAVDAMTWGEKSHSRSSAPESAGPDFMLRSDDGCDSLFVTTAVTDGIAVGDSFAKSRNAQVSGTEGLTSFGCIAYTIQGGNSHFYIPAEEYVRDDAGSYKCRNVYYWPGSQINLDFYNYAPFKAEGLTPPATPASKILQYVVPDDVTKQSDLMLAVKTGVAGNTNTSIPLEFRHLLSAVKVTAGTLPSNTFIKSVSFTNLYGSANFDMDAQRWTEYSEYGHAFTVTLNRNFDSGEAILDGKNTMMMLPQEMLPDGVLEATMLKVIINDGQNERELTADLSGSWLMGKTYNYKISITSDFQLEFTDSNQKEADAHYCIVPIHISAHDLKGKGFTVTSQDASVCKLRRQLVGENIEGAGYWPYEGNGNPSEFDRTESVTVADEEGDDIRVFAFIKENPGTDDRKVSFTLSMDNKVVGTLTINQRCPVWINGIGWENVEEEGRKPYGFAWTRKVTYEIDGSNNWWVAFMRLIGNYKDGNGIKWEHVGSWISGHYNCTLDFSQVQSLSGVFSTTDGLDNSRHFTSNNAANLQSLESELQNMGHIISEDGNNIESTDFAALVALKKNQCKVQKQGSGSSVAYIPSFNDNDIKWFLPASGQFAQVPDGMSGSYWSSTADATNSAIAFSWNESTITSSPRMVLMNVRAARTGM